MHQLGPNDVDGIKLRRLAFFSVDDVVGNRRRRQRKK